MKRKLIFASTHDPNLPNDLENDQYFLNERDEDESVIEDNEVDDDFYSSEEF